MSQLLDVALALHLQRQGVVDIRWVLDACVEMGAAVVVAEVQSARIHVDESRIEALCAVVGVVVAKDGVPQTMVVKVEVPGARPRFRLHAREVVVVA